MPEAKVARYHSTQTDRRKGTEPALAAYTTQSLKRCHAGSRSRSHVEVVHASPCTTEDANQLLGPAPMK